MEKIYSFLQLSGMVLKKNSVLSILLVLFWNLLTVGSIFWCIYDSMVYAVDANAGFMLLNNSYLIFTGLFQVLGSLTLGHLLDACPDLHHSKRFPFISSLFVLLIGSAGIVLSMIIRIYEGMDFSMMCLLVLYLGIVSTNIKTVLVAGSAFNTFQTKCLGLTNPSMLDCQEMLASFKIMKKKMAPMLLGTFSTLTALLILASYDSYVMYACYFEEMGSALVPYVIIDISVVVSSTALMLYLAQLAEDTFEAFTSNLENLRLFIFNCNQILIIRKCT